ncbi:CCAAT/enhancer-binding protein 2-like isoform X2 [Homalodisca vitripennis]|uniref:CCAAT/enhancer-binding protein 2-like isoform X2 n=1 Tax=Homalodisca vitripennis TaxID=197043 RepID=UPI001EEBD952|nr:CCAAT/enhancer-binding protein 2-like isoform X2 [Homalodisca vitripennis]
METSNEQRPTIKHRSLKCHSDSDSGKDEIYRQHRNRNNEAVERCRKRKAEQAERIKGRIEDLERQNEKLSGYIEAQKQEIIRMQKNCEELRGNSLPSPTKCCQTLWVRRFMVTAQVT